MTITATTSQSSLEPGAPASTSAPAYNEPPLELIRRLSRLLWVRVPVVKQSASLLCQWAEELHAWLGFKASAVAALDDEIEANGALFERITANDAPADRAQVRAILARLSAAVTRESRHLTAGRDLPEVR